MAYLRILSTRATRAARAYNPSFSYVLAHHYSDENSPSRTLPQQEVQNFIQQKTIGSWFNNSFERPVGFFHGKTAPQPHSLGWNPAFGFVHYTTDGKSAGDEMELMSNQAAADLTAQVVANPALVVDEVAVAAAANQVPVVNEVAIAAADSFLPVAGAQHFIDAVHTFTGFNWWASIAVSALLMNVATSPLTIEIAKFTPSKKRLVVEQSWAFIHQMLNEFNKGVASTSDTDLEKYLKLFDEVDVNLSVYFLCCFARTCVFWTFLLGIINMVDKVSSFTNGGAFWFMDLTTPDSFYIFPCLTGLSGLFFWILWRVGAFLHGVENSVNKNMRIHIGLSLAFLGWSVTWPTAVFCFLIPHWCTGISFNLLLASIQARAARSADQRIKQARVIKSADQNIKHADVVASSKGTHQEKPCNSQKSDGSIKQQVMSMYSNSNAKMLGDVKGRKKSN